MWLKKLIEASFSNYNFWNQWSKCCNGSAPHGYLRILVSSICYYFTFCWSFIHIYFFSDDFWNVQDPYLKKSRDKIQGRNFLLIKGGEIVTQLLHLASICVNLCIWSEVTITKKKKGKYVLCLYGHSHRLALLLGKERRAILIISTILTFSRISSMHI